MIARNETLDDMAGRAFEAAAPYCRRDVLPTEVIERASGVLRYTKHWHSVVRKFRRRLLRERKIALLPVPGVGFRLCTHDEQINVTADGRQRRAARQLRTACEEVRATPAEELTDYQRRVKAFRLSEMRDTRVRLKRSMRKQTAAATPHECLPRRKNEPQVHAEPAPI